MLLDKVDLHGQKTWPSRWPCLNWLLSGHGSLSSHTKHPLSSCLLDVCFCLMPMYPGQAYLFGCLSSSAKTCIQIVAKHICIKLRGLQDTTKSKLSLFPFPAEPRFTHKNNLVYLGICCAHDNGPFPFVHVLIGCLVCARSLLLVATFHVATYRTDCLCNGIKSSLTLLVCLRA